MDMPDKQNPLWKTLVTGEKKYEFQILSTKILMGRILLRAQMEPTAISKCIDEVYDYFSKNIKLTEPDLKKIFG